MAREGDPADGLHLLVEGRISLETHLPRRGDVVLSTVEPGGVVGWSWMFPPHEWQVDAVAAVDSTAVVLEAGPLRAVLEARPRLDAEVTRRLARVVTGRLVEARTQLLDLYGTPGGTRR